MLYYVGPHPNDEQAELTALSAGLGVRGAGGSQTPLEVGCYYWPVDDQGQRRGWPRVWLHQKDGSQGWFDFFQLSDMELSQLANQLWKIIQTQLHTSLIEDIYYNPNKGPSNNGQKKLAGQHGQMLRQWVGEDSVYLWVARGEGPSTQWFKVGS